MVYMDDMTNMVGILNIKEMVDIEDKMDMEVIIDMNKGVDVEDMENKVELEVTYVVQGVHNKM